MTMHHLSPDTTLNWQSVDFPRPVFVRSPFQPHQLQPHDFRVKTVTKLHPEWVSGVLLFCFLLLAWGQVFYRRRINQIYRAPFSKRFINQLIRDGNLFRERISIVLGIIYLLSFSLLVYIMNEKLTGFSIEGIGGLELYVIIVAGLMAYLTVKLTMVQIIGAIFKTRETTLNYLLNLLIFALISGPLLLVALVLIVYLQSTILLIGCIAVFLILFIFRFFRGFFIGLTLRKFSYLFLFVYLCSLEILPLLVLLKVLITYTHSAGA